MMNFMHTQKKGKEYKKGNKIVFLYFLFLQKDSPKILLVMYDIPENKSRKGMVSFSLKKFDIL